MTAAVSDSRLREEIAELKIRLEESEATLDAIRNGEVDAVVMRDASGERVYTLGGAEQPYRLLIEAMHQGAATLGTDGTILYCNHSFAEMMQQPQELLIGSSVSRLFLAEETTMTQLLAEGTESTELKIRRDGPPVAVSASVGILHLQASTAVFLILRDLTEQKKHEALKETDRRKDEFLAMLAHELRNPLAPISSAIAMLNISNRNQDPIVQTVCDIVQRQTHQLTRIVDDLLDVSRITRGVVVLQKQIHNVSALVSDAVDTSRPLVNAQEHRLHISLPKQSLYINGDYARLSQVLANLLNNAAKYTDAGGDIWVDVTREANEIRISVRDSGIGIASDLLPKVFDIFTQSERSIDRSQGGLGIGLTVARSMVALHDGRIEALSDGHGSGSEFVIYLPVHECEEPAPAPVAEPAKPGKSRRVLVVDDNRDAADGMTMLLEIAGQEARAVYDGRDAIAAVQDFKPDLVLLDIGLPGMDGYEVARHLRLQHPGDLVLAALTGYGDEDDRRRSREAGFDHHYVKPIDFKTLSEVLERL